MGALGMAVTIVTLALLTPTVDFPVSIAVFVILLFLGILLLLAAGYEFFTIFYKKRSKEDDHISDQDIDSPKYAKKSYILSVPERNLYSLLKSILPPNRYEVFCQSALVSVIDKVTHTSYRNELFRVIDYCIVDKQTNEPLLLIELNDASHRRSEVVERDRKVAAICHNAGIAVISFTLEESQDAAFVERMLRSYL